jgi:integrase
MARQTKRLTDRHIKALKKPDRYADGNNLYLVVDKSKGGLSKRWTSLFKSPVHHRPREQGLGAYPKVSLAEARRKAAESRDLLDQGKDPLDEAKAALVAKKAQESRKTFGQCATSYFETKKQGWRSGARQWLHQLSSYCQPIWDMPVADVDTAAVLGVLQPLWQRIPATAPRIRGRIENVLDAAKVAGFRAGENPARGKGHLALLLPRRPKGSRPHYAALPYAGVPEFIAKLRENTTLHARCLEFVILTASRQGEALGAKWDEIDLDAKVWTIPGSRMKAGIEHRVPLSSRAVEIIEHQATIRHHGYLFPGLRANRPLSPARLRLLAPEGGTVHGFRSSFRDWCGDQTSFEREICEAALAHASGDQTERAYRRGDSLEKRRVLMEAWDRFCDPAASGNVIALKTVQR